MSDITAPPRVSSSPTVMVGGRSWAIGLRWEIPSSPHEAEKQAKARAKAEGIEAYAIHRSADGTVEYGLARSYLARQPSLASALVASRPGSWTAMFRLPDNRWYVVASRNGAIDPLSDLAFANTREAIDRVADIDNAMGGRNAIYVAESIGFGAREESWPLDEAVANLKPKAKLQATDPFKRLVGTGLKIAIGVGVLTASYYIYDYTTALPPETVPLKPVSVPAAPWLNKESGVEAAEFCLDAMVRFPTSAPGWTRAPLVCQNGDLAAVFTRNKSVDQGGAPVSWLTQAIRSSGWPEKGLKITSTNSSYSMSLPLAKTIWNKNDHPRRIEEILPVLLSRLDDALINPTLGKADGKYYKSQPISFRTTLPPTTVLRQFSGIVGLTLDKIVYDGNGYETTLVLHHPEALPTTGRIEIAPPPPTRIFDLDYANPYHEK